MDSKGVVVQLVWELEEEGFDSKRCGYCKGRSQLGKLPEYIIDLCSKYQRQAV